jgi:hypothetical protein
VQRVRIPAGPAVVLLLFAIFLAVYGVTRLRAAAG